MRKLFILLAAVAFVFAFTAPAKADVSMSGYVAFNTYWNDVDNPAPTKDDSDLFWTMDAGCSRLTFNFKEGPFGGLVEIRPNGDGWLRHWYATWNFGAGTLGIGQSWTPDFASIATAKYNCGGSLSSYGNTGTSARAEMVQLQFGNFKIAGTTPKEPAAHFVGGNWDTSIPKLMASYDLNVAMAALKFFGAYQTIDDKVVATEKTYGIDSMSYGVTAALGFGALTVKAALWGGTNIKELGYGALGFTAYYDAASDSIKDADAIGYGLTLIYKVNDAWTVTGGYFGTESELDRTGTWEDPSAAYVVNATWRVAKNVYITPEYLVQDKDDITQANIVTKEAKTTWYGVYWQIKF